MVRCFSVHQLLLQTGHVCVDVCESVFVLLWWSQVAELTSRLQKKKDELASANEMRMQKVEKLITNNADLTVRNAALKVHSISLNAHKSRSRLGENALTEMYSIYVCDCRRLWLDWSSNSMTLNLLLSRRKRSLKRGNTKLKSANIRSVGKNILDKYKL